MKRCPHCGEPGLSWLHFSLATRHGPTACRVCRGLSYPGEALLVVASVVGSVLPIIALVGAIYMNSLWPLYIAGGLLLLYPVTVLALPAKKTTREASQASYRRWKIGVAVFILLVVIAGVCQSLGVG